MVTSTAEPAPKRLGTGNHLCPPWVGFLLASPIRRLFDDPKRLLDPFVEPGMTVLDVGSSMGFHSLILAGMVGSSGRVVSLDVQERMLRGLRKRARRKGLDERIDTRVCTQDDLGIADLCGQVDVALAFHVIHEMTEPEPILRQVHEALHPGGQLLVAEPPGHVSAEEMVATVAMIGRAGFVESRDLDVRRSRAALFEREA